MKIVGSILWVGLSATSIGSFAMPANAEGVLRGGGLGMGPAYGSLSAESKDPKSAYEQVVKACQEMGASITSYNVYTNAQNGKIQISAQIQVDKDKAVELMSRIGTLAEVKNQNLAQNYNNKSADQLKKEVEDLDKEIKDVMGRPDPVLIGYAIQQRQNLQAQLQQMQNTQAFTTISLNIQEPNQDQPGAPLKKQENMGWLSGGLALVSFILGTTFGMSLAKPKAA